MKGSYPNFFEIVKTYKDFIKGVQALFTFL